MRLTVLGSGTTSPHPDRASSGYWLETAAGSVLLDCSAAAMHRMAEENLPWHELDAIWISHFHLDHVAGVAPLLFGTKYAAETRERTKPLKIFGPKGLKELLETFSDAANYRLFEQPFPLETIEVEPLEQFELLSGLMAATFDTPHTAESMAIHIRDEADKTLVYSADTGFSEPLTAFARRVDLFILECTFIRNKPNEIHIELAEAVWMVRKAEPKQAVLTHLDAEWDNVDFDALVAESGPNLPIIEAKDGLVLDI